MISTAVGGRRTSLSTCARFRISVRTSHLVCDVVDTLKCLVYHAVTTMPIRDLATHPRRYLTVAELAEYWAVSRQQIYKRIESGALATIRFGARCYRIPIRSALAFEDRAQVVEWNNTQYARAGARTHAPHASAQQDRLAARAAGRGLEFTGWAAFHVALLFRCAL